MKNRKLKIFNAEVETSGLRFIMASGMTFAEILEDYEDLELADLQACLVLPPGWQGLKM